MRARERWSLPTLPQCPSASRLTPEPAPWLTLPITEAEVKPSSSVSLPLRVRGEAVGELRWEGSMQTMDGTGKVMGEGVAVVVTASVYQLDVELDWAAAGGEGKGIDFGCVRVRGGGERGRGDG